MKMYKMYEQQKMPINSGLSEICLNMFLNSFIEGIIQS